MELNPSAWDQLREQNNRRAGILLRIASVLGDAPTRAEGDLPEAVADLIVERDRLRAFAEAAHSYVFALEGQSEAVIARARRAYEIVLAALDEIEEP